MKIDQAPTWLFIHPVMIRLTLLTVLDPRRPMKRRGQSVSTGDGAHAEFMQRLEREMSTPQPKRASRDVDVK